MKHALAALPLLAIAACVSAAPTTPVAPPATVETLSANRFRISVAAGAGESNALLKDRAMLRGAQHTLEKGEEWFEIAGEIAGEGRHTIIIVTGSGETLAGGASQTHDAREIVRRLQSRIG